MLKINEIFDTIQGEAHYTGTPATFIDYKVVQLVVIGAIQNIHGQKVQKN